MQTPYRGFMPNGVRVKTRVEAWTDHVKRSLEFLDIISYHMHDSAPPSPRALDKALVNRQTRMPPGRRSHFRGWGTSSQIFFLGLQSGASATLRRSCRIEFVFFRMTSHFSCNFSCQLEFPDWFSWFTWAFSSKLVKFNQFIVKNILNVSKNAAKQEIPSTSKHFLQAKFLKDSPAEGVVSNSFRSVLTSFPLLKLILKLDYFLRCWIDWTSSRDDGKNKVRKWSNFALGPTMQALRESEHGEETQIPIGEMPIPGRRPSFDRYSRDFFHFVFVRWFYRSERLIVEFSRYRSLDVPPCLRFFRPTFLIHI